jgi:hypothetical protein
MPIVLILGLVLGIPAVIGIAILAVVFGLTFFAVKKGQEVMAQV